MLNRLAALPPPAGALAEAVAVFEDEVPLHLAAALAQVDPTAAGAAVDELVRADVLAPRDPLGFRHPLLRAAVYGATPAAAACRDARAGGAVVHSVRGRARSRCARTCCCRRSGGDAAVVETLRSAAGRALETAAPGSAVQYLERALREPPPAATRAAVLAELGHAEAVAGRSEAVEHLESAIALGERGVSAPSCCWPSAGHCTTAAGWRRPATRSAGASTSCATRAEQRSELRVELEGGYLNSALFTPERARDAHQRARRSWPAARR